MTWPSLPPDTPSPLPALSARRVRHGELQVTDRSPPLQDAYWGSAGHPGNTQVPRAGRWVGCALLRPHVCLMFLCWSLCVCAKCLSSFPTWLHVTSPSTSSPSPHLRVPLAHAQPRNVFKHVPVLGAGGHGSARHKTDTISAHQLRALKSQDGPFEWLRALSAFQWGGGAIMCLILSGNGHTPLICEAGVFRHACAHTHAHTHTHTHTHTVSRTEATSCRVRGRAVSCSREQGHSTGSVDQHLYMGTHLPQCPTRGPRDTM